MKRFGGLLPCKADLERLGLSGLVCQMNCHPEAFAHIEQERRTRNQQRVVARAELLATLNGGFLPTKQWLENNGYNDVLLLRRLRPKLLHLTMANLDNKIFPAGSKWVPVALKLARQNRGSLPCLDWLKHKGFGPMVRAIKRHRKMFQAIKKNGRRVWNGKGCTKPRSARAWLTRNGFSSRMLVANPRAAFRRIPMNSKLAKARVRTARSTP